MIQAIFCFQFIINEEEQGRIEPELQPLRMIFNNKEFSEENYTDLLAINDIYGIFYFQTVGTISEQGLFGNFYMGRLRKTPYQVISYFLQDAEGRRFITIAVFELDDELEIFDDVIKDLGKKLDDILPDLGKTNPMRQIILYEKLITQLEYELKFALFQIDRLSRLDKLQKIALIFHSEERKKILELLRQRPIAKKDLKEELKKLKTYANTNILLKPFLDLNIARCDWFKKGKEKKKKFDEKGEGEFVFLIKDVIIGRLPSATNLESLKTKKPDLFSKYKERVAEFFSKYDINEQNEEEIQKLTNILLNPDMYDFIDLLKTNYYPLDKLPKILSDFIDLDTVLSTLKEMNIIAIVEDDDKEEKQKWVVLLTEIQPIITFPEYLLPEILMTHATSDKNKKVSYDVAKRAYELLESTYYDNLDF